MKLPELRAMVKWLGFTHVWIALGAMSATWASISSMEQHKTIGFFWEHAQTWSLGMGIATGWVYTAQRMIKLNRRPEGIPEKRAAFLNQWGTKMVWTWTFLLLGWLWWTPIPLANMIQWTSHASGPILALVVLAAGYASNPFGKTRGWREMPKWKLPVISISWALATVWIPFEIIGLEDPWSAQQRWAVGAASACAQLLFVAGLTLPFDIRDLHVDPDEMRTIPQRRGRDRSIQISMILMWMGCVAYAFIDATAARVLAGLCAMVLVWFSRRQQSEWVYSLGLDGCLVLQGAIAFFMCCIV